MKKKWHCGDCGWFNPDEDGTFFCDEVNKVVTKRSCPCKWLELIDGKDQEPMEV